MISQVLSDFVGEVKANLGMEIQMRTRYEGDLNRLSMKYGEDISTSVVKESVGTGMIEFSEYNRGRPYFVAFRPIFHNPSRLSEAELSKYERYDNRLKIINFNLKKLEDENVDVFDLQTEVKLAEAKLSTGSFDMVDIYVAEIEKRIDIQWSKIGKKKPDYNEERISKEELEESVEKAERLRKRYDEKTGSKPKKITPESVNEHLSDVKDVLNKMKSGGKDVYIEEIEFDRIKSQLDIATKTNDINELKMISKNLDKLEKDLNK